MSEPQSKRCRECGAPVGEWRTCPTCQGQGSITVLGMSCGCLRCSGDGIVPKKSLDTIPCAQPARHGAAKLDAIVKPVKEA